jgi:hypothetical protein
MNWLEAHALLSMIGGLLCFFCACQKNLNVLAYVLAGVCFPIAGVVAVAVDPAR